MTNTPDTEISFKPVGAKIHVRKCVTGTPEEHDGRIYHMVGELAVTDERADYQRWCEIVGVGDGCKMFNSEHIGKFVHLPEFQPNHVYRVGSSDDFVVRESLFDENLAPAMVVGD